MYVLNYLIPEQPQYISVHGHKMLIHRENNKPIDGVGKEMIFWGVYDRYTTLLFEKFINEGMNVIDVGAHIGYYTLLAARLAGDDGSVFAFEPEQRNYNLLLENIKLNGYKNVIPLQKAVSCRTEKSRLFLDEATSVAHSLYKTSQDTKEAVVVNTISLDEFFEDKKRAIHVVKIDAEGAEMTVLIGMRNIIRENEVIKIFTEFWPEGLKRAGCSPQEYWAELIKYGFKFIYLINEHKQRLEPADLDKIVTFCKNPSHYSVNLLCARTPVKNI